MPFLTTLLGVCMIGISLWGILALLAGWLTLTWYIGLGLVVLFIGGYALVNHVCSVPKDDDEEPPLGI